MKWAKKAWNYYTYDATHKKSETQNQKFFSLQIQRLVKCRVFWGFEQLSNTITWQAIPLVKQLKTAWFRLNHTDCEGEGVEEQKVTIEPRPSF